MIQFNTWYTSRKTQHGLQELLIVDLNPAISVGIMASKRFGKLPDDDASTDEAIKGDSRRRHARSDRDRGFDVYPYG